MPLPVRKVKISLDKDTPTKVTIDDLQSDLIKLGLTCQYTQKDNLESLVNQIRGQLGNGSVQSYGIMQPKKSANSGLSYKSEFGEAAPYYGLELAANGNWKPSDTALGYISELEKIIYPAHFDYLKDNKPGFAGQKTNDVNHFEKYETVDAIKNLFINTAVTASATVVEGIDKDSLEATLSRILKVIDDVAAENYDDTNSRVIFLVCNYNPTKQEADGIGALVINWHLKIKDYKASSASKKHDTALTLSARSVLYDSVEAINSDAAFIDSHFKENLFLCLNAIPVKNNIEIFPSLPPATKDTFNKSLPVISTEDFVEVIVLNTPNLDNLGCIDNSNSDAESNYTKSITSGFTFATSQQFSVGFSCEATVEFIKAGYNIGFSITFTEQWSKSTTETIGFSVPEGKKAYIYQGYLRATKLRYLPKTDSYAYTEDAKFITNILTTTRAPLEVHQGAITLLKAGVKQQ